MTQTTTDQLREILKQFFEKYRWGDKKTMDIALARLTAVLAAERLDELEKFGEVEFDNVPLDIIHWVASRKVELKKEGGEL